MREIPLTKGAVALVDDEDYELVADRSWHLHTEGYAVWRSADGRTVYMHRLIMNAPPGIEVDHRFPPRSDNRRANLRLATDSQQLVNRPRPPDAAAPYRGLSFHKPSGKWCARIKIDRRKFSLGYFDSPEDAARAYNAAALVLHGDFAQLNPVEGEPPRSSWGASGYRGVYSYNNSGRWKACTDNQIIGIFDDSEEAARAYDAVAIRLRGPFTRVNFPLEALRQAANAASTIPHRKEK